MRSEPFWCRQQVGVSWRWGRAGPPERAGLTHRATGVARRLKLLPVVTPVRQRGTVPRKKGVSKKVGQARGIIEAGLQVSQHLLRLAPAGVGCVGGKGWVGVRGCVGGCQRCVGGCKRCVGR